MVEESYTGEEKRHLPRTPASEISYKLFGLPSAANQYQVTAMLATRELVLKNSNRLSLLFINNSAGVVYIGFVPEITSSYSLPLAANGGMFQMNIRDEGEAVASSIYVQGSADNLVCTVIETILTGK